MIEIWKPILSLDSKYEASNLGRIRNSNGQYKGRILKELDYTFGRINRYLHVAVYSTGKQVYKKIHRLVAECFCENPNNYPIVMHLDNNPKNNLSSNLMWGTLKMNSQQMIRDGRANKCKGSKHHFSKLTEDIVADIKNKYIPRKYTLKMLAREYNVSYGLIGHIVKNRNWKHVKV